MKQNEKKRTEKKKETKHTHEESLSQSHTTIKTKLKCQVKCEESFATPKKYCFCHCNDGIILPIWQCVHNATLCHYFCCCIHNFFFFFVTFFVLFASISVFLVSLSSLWISQWCEWTGKMEHVHRTSKCGRKPKINHYHTDKDIVEQKHSVRCCKSKWKKNSNALDKCEIKERKMFFNRKDGSKEEKKKTIFKA